MGRAAGVAERVRADGPLARRGAQVEHADVPGAGAREDGVWAQEIDGEDVGLPGETVVGLGTVVVVVVVLPVVVVEGSEAGAGGRGWGGPGQGVLLELEDALVGAGDAGEAGVARGGLEGVDDGGWGGDGVEFEGAEAEAGFVYAGGG